jgi:hypothetical protein
MTIEKDAIVGSNFLLGLAQIEAHTGQSEEAVKILRQLLTIPAGEYVSPYAPEDRSCVGPNP